MCSVLRSLVYPFCDVFWVWGKKSLLSLSSRILSVTVLLYHSVFKLSYELMVCNIMNTGKPKNGIQFEWPCTPNFPGGKVGT